MALVRYNPYAEGHVEMAGRACGKTVWRVVARLDASLAAAAEAAMADLGYVRRDGIALDGSGKADGWVWRD